MLITIRIGDGIVIGVAIVAGIDGIDGVIIITDGVIMGGITGVIMVDTVGIIIVKVFNLVFQIVKLVFLILWTRKVCLAKNLMVIC